MTTTVQQATERLTGTRGHTEGTGGGCEALVFPLESGAVLVLTSEALVPVWDGQDDRTGWEISAGIYRAEDWQNGGDSIADAWRDTVTPDTLREVLADLRLIRDDAPETCTRCGEEWESPDGRGVTGPCREDEDGEHTFPGEFGDAYRAARA